MTEAELTTNQMAALNLVWDEYKSTDDWPSRHRMLAALDGLGIDLDAEVLSLEGVSGGGHSSFEARVKLHWTLAVRIAEVRELLEQLPRLVRLAAGRFLAGDPFKGIQLDQSDFAAIWGARDGELAYRVIKDMDVGAVPWALASSTAEGFTLTVDFRILRYEHAQSLADLLAVNPFGQRTPASSHPHGRHRTVLKAIYEHLMSRSEWPVAVPFAIAHRQVGYVPDLLNDLHPDFVRDSFGHAPHHRLSLTTKAIRIVDDDGRLQETILAMLQACAAIWRRWPEKQPIPLAEVGAHMKVSAASLVPAAEYLNWEKWCSVSHGGNGGEVALVVNELVRRARDVSTWDEYVTVFHSVSGTEGHQWSSASPASTPAAMTTAASPTNPFECVAPHLALLTCEDLRRNATDVLTQAAATYRASAWRMCLVATGVVAETVLLDVANRSPHTAESYMNGRKWPDKAGLGDMLRIALHERLINETTHKMGGLIADYRNLIHPHRARSLNADISEPDAQAAAHFLCVLVANLASSAESDALLKYEKKG